MRRRDLLQTQNKSWMPRPSPSLDVDAEHRKSSEAWFGWGHPTFGVCGIERAVPSCHLHHLKTVTVEY
jgi:hypothetical protein